MTTRTSLALLAWLAAPGAFGAELQLSVPPQQQTPWVASESVPTNLVSAVTTLFTQGFPDPRGCEFCQITIEVSSVWGEPRGFRGGTNLDQETKAQPARTTGWLLPASGSQTQRCAIGWNGLIYPVVEFGAPADLSAEAANPPRVIGVSPYYYASGEMHSVFSTNAGSSRLLLLLRSGQTDAALMHWKLLNQQQQFTRSTRSNTPAGLADNTYDPYFDFAGEWAWTLFDRAVCAHMRGDEALALATTRTLSEVQPRIESEAARRGFQRQRYYNSPRSNQEKPYLDFLDRLPRLLADLERREREGVRVPILEGGLTNLLAAGERIDALIRDLDLVAARQWGQPGGVVPAQDPIVAALIQEGDAAVTPLIDCLATDQRLTRSVSFGRDFFPGRNVIPVTTAARTALQAILQTDFSSAAEWRAYWQRFHGMRIEERWFTLLQDNAAGMGRWVEVAGDITRPDNVFVAPGTGFSYGTPATSNAPARLRGEWLRFKSQPSVSDLLARRALEVVPTNAASYDLATACEIGLCLAVWDAAAAGPVATILVKRFQTVAEYSGARSQRAWEQQRLGTLAAKLMGVRAQLGEAGALEDYAAWLATATPETLGNDAAQSLSPLMRFGTNAVIQSVAEKLFASTNSPWGKLPWKSAGGFNPMESELVQLPAFRRLLVRELDVKTVCGSVDWRSGLLSYQLTNSTPVSGSFLLALPEVERPAAGTKAELRWCDWIALSLANAKRIPTFDPFARREQRDEAIRQAQAQLQPPQAP